MAKVEIYTAAHCPYCDKAKALLLQKGQDYEEIRIDIDADARETMLARTEGRRSVPQIFINDRGIGGCDDLYALERDGQLDNLLVD